MAHSLKKREKWERYDTGALNCPTREVKKD
jgi:hypothetical protein